MTADYKLTYRTPSGLKMVDSLPFSSLDYTRKENEVGELTVVLPPLFPIGYFAKDGRLEIWRSVNGSSYYLDTETAWFILRARYTTADTGESVVEIKAQDANTLLKRRLIAYENGSTYTDKFGYADDTMKDIVRENYGLAAIDANRNISSYLTVEVNKTQGAIVGDQIGWRNVLDAIKTFASASEELGVRIIFDVVCTGPNSFEFRTYARYRGNDHSRSSASPILIAQEMGNLSGPEIINDYTEEANYMYAGGKGEESYRLMTEVADISRIGLSAFARTESFVNASNVADPDKLASIAKAALRDQQPRILFNGRLMDTPATTYGLHYRWGDLLTAQYNGYVVDCRVEAVHVRVDTQGEQLDIRLEGDQE